MITGHSPHASSSNKTHRYDDERGAALIVALFTALLILLVGGALIITSARSFTTTADATGETQAYVAAEAGLQATLAVLRGNVQPNPLFNATVSNEANKLGFRRAVTRANSNKDVTAEQTTSARLRLSRWLPYDATFNDRVPLSASYNLMSGTAYSIELQDPAYPTPALIAAHLIANANYAPARLLVIATGYGPRGARKQLMMMVKKAALEFDPPATITLAGGSAMTFDLGSSNSSGFSGVDASGQPIVLPAVAVSPANLTQATTEITDTNTNGSGTQVNPATPTALTSTNTPSFLTSPDAARDFLFNPDTGMKSVAENSSRYFSSRPADMGTSAAPKITFIDNYNGARLNLGTGFQGAGLLIVTGEVDTDGGTSFDGIILVLGRGILRRSGGGNGTIGGAIIVASFDPFDSTADTFGSPIFDMSGGGNSTTTLNIANVQAALATSGRVVEGVVEN